MRDWIMAVIDNDLRKIAWFAIGTFLVGCVMGSVFIYFTLFKRPTAPVVKVIDPCEAELDWYKAELSASQDAADRWNRAVDACERDLRKLRQGYIADQVSMRELENCPGFVSFAEICRGDVGKQLIENLLKDEFVD